MNYKPESITQFLADVRSHCRKCMGGAGNGAARCEDESCDLHKYRLKPAQIDIFDSSYRRAWLDEHFAEAQKMRRFFYSDLRVQSHMGSAHKNWHGTLAKMLYRKGFRKTGNKRPSPLPQCNGHADYEWALMEEMV